MRQMQIKSRNLAEVEKIVWTRTVQAVELDGVRYVADHGDEVADGEGCEHVVAGGEHVTTSEDGDHEQAADDAKNADDNADVAMIATVLQ